MPIVSRRPVEWFPGHPTVRKPRLRGWIHFIAAPLSLAASIVLTILAPTTGTKWASAVYMLASFILFGVSALYHLFYWSPRAETFLRRMDHSNIFLLIAGTYTPLAVSLFDRSQATILLAIVWIGALVGILVNLFWPTAPRWLSTLIYVILGWTAIWYLPAMWQSGGPAVVWLVLIGGILYTIGAVAYAMKKPNPWPRWFGFHEVFHAFTVAAWACQCIAAYIAVL
ncbi:hemolysin III family protein [Actinomycetaceae bacterium WB03_NA08]|uniref:Hemolysin III family protein n=1 Tax=Scrofimicrobium canadense TaxID=2652290 RepID=A0A6N7W2B1_9ACTO|nr:hemolysin III family protein [Scrofimicrobium canadense]MSS83425.1 hemolysin III family protein [Scrofimicrobium canadense]